jgi:hypothetical protein
MGFKLKTNQRKVESGLTLTAKIVSPDKTAYDYQNFNIVVQPQGLSDKEKVIRDSQTIASILDSNNPDWTRITDKIRGITEAARAATYCNVYYGDITLNSASNTLIDNGEDQNGMLIVNVNNGEVYRRPPYDVNRNDAGFTAILQMSVQSGEEVEIVRRPFTVPMYTKADVLATIGDQLTEGRLWELVKGNNVNKNSVHTNLIKPSIKATLQGLGLSNIVDSTNVDNLPLIEFTYPSYYTTSNGLDLVSANGEVAAISASEVWQLNRDLYNVNGLSSAFLTSTECNNLGIENEKSKGEVAVYRFNSKQSSNNKITMKLSYDNGAISITKEVTGVCFLSKKISADDVRSNISQSFSLGWIIPSDFLSRYGLADSIIGTNNSQANRKNIEIPNGNHIVFKLPAKFSTLVSFDSNPVTDALNIGYSYNPSDGNMVGFTDTMFGSLQINFSKTLHSTYQLVIDANPSDSVGDDSAFTSDANNTKYLYLNSAEASALTGSFTLTFAENSLGLTGNVTIYFEVTITQGTTPSGGGSGDNSGQTDNPSDGT